MPFLKRVAEQWRKLLAVSSAAAGTVLLAKYGEAVFDSVTSALGKTLSLQIGFVSVVSSAYLGWLVYKHRKEKPEVERLLNGIEFRRGPRTGYVWMPFCPQCHVVLYPKWDGFELVRCSAGCGWQSTIKPRELCKIINENNK